jgi:hypothetical protein
MKNLPKTGSNTPAKRKTLREAPAHPKDAYTHATSINGNLDTRRKPATKPKRAKKV